jgi:hypothetical protein
MATCRPTLFLLIVKEILLVHFIITNFRVAHKMLCTPWLRFRILDIQILNYCITRLENVILQVQARFVRALAKHFLAV